MCLCFRSSVSSSGLRELVCDLRLWDVLSNSNVVLLCLFRLYTVILYPLVSMVGGKVFRVVRFKVVDTK